MSPPKPNPIPQDRPGVVLIRALSGVAGVLLFLGGAVVTLGVAPIVLLALVITAIIRRRRGKPLTLPGSWFTATTAATVVLVIGAGLLYIALPDGALEEARAAAEAAEAQPQPEWVSRLGAPAEADPLTEQLLDSRAFTTYFGILGASIAFLLFGGIFGSIGWATSLLLGYSMRGRWPFARRVEPYADAPVRAAVAGGE